MPAAEWLRHYQGEWLKADAVAVIATVVAAGAPVIRAPGQPYTNSETVDVTADDADRVASVPSRSSEPFTVTARVSPARMSTCASSTDSAGNTATAPCPWSSRSLRPTPFPPAPVPSATAMPTALPTPC